MGGNRMKRFLLIMIALVCTISPCLAAFDGVDEYFIICTPGTSVNVRISPNAHAEVIGSKFFGDQVFVDKEKNGFVHITNLNSEYTEGWISKGLLTDDKPIEVNAAAVIVSNARVAGRKYVNGKVIKWLKNGMEVMIYAASEEWCVTDKGYIKREFIEIQEQKDGS